MIIYFEEKVTTCKLLKEIRTIFVRWETFDGHKHVIPCLQAQIETIQSGAAETILVDTLNCTGKLSDEDTEFLYQIALPEMEKGGLKSLITVLPRNDWTTKESAKRWIEVTSDCAFGTYEAFTVDDGFELISQLSLQR